MNLPDEESAFRRILVALDASPHSLAALQAAVTLAVQQGAELQGLYIEDITVLRLASLPVSRRVAVYTLETRQLDREEMEKELRAQARQARLALAESATRARLRWSFRVVQGLIDQELLNAAREVDLILLGKAGWSRSRRLGSTAQVILREAPTRVMILQQGARLAHPVGLIYDGSEKSRKALQTAAGLLQAGQDFLNIFVLAGDYDTARASQAEISAWLREHGLQARYRWLVDGRPAALYELIKAEGCGVLILPARCDLLPDEELTGLVNALGCPMLLVQ
jgi:nucleotide-binding universal stress UspA family protein